MNSFPQQIEGELQATYGKNGSKLDILSETSYNVMMTLSPIPTLIISAV